MVDEGRDHDQFAAAEGDGHDGGCSSGHLGHDRAGQGQLEGLFDGDVRAQHGAVGEDDHQVR